MNTPTGVVRGDGGEPLDGWDDPIRGLVAWRTLFSGDVTDTDRLTCGVAVLEPGGWLGLHRHAAAEVYHVIEGEGVVTLAGAEHPVTVGSAVAIPADVEHGIRNSGPGVLRFFYCLAADSFSDVEYRFTDETRYPSTSTRRRQRTTRQAESSAH